MRLAIVACAFFLVTPHASATNYKSKLAKVLHTIKKVSTHLDDNKKKQTDIQQQLKTAEIAIGKMSETLQDKQKAIQEHKAAIDALNKQQEDYAHQRKQQQEVLAQLIRSAYQLRHLNYIKIIISPKSADKAGRMLAYYHYINLNRINLLKKLNETLNDIQMNKQAVRKHVLALQTLNMKQQKEQRALEIKREKRRKILALLTETIHTQKQQLDTLVSNKNNLENLIARIEREQTAQKAFYGYKGAFARLRGKLSWPTRGQIINHYKAQMIDGRLKSNGVLIKAAQGQNIYAIAPGKVVFSDWLPGYGLLLILDHGDGYMTLYGHNHSLYIKHGDRVKSGKLIASAGKSGGQRQSGLYFEVRHNGKPINPERWCHRV